MPRECKVSYFYDTDCFKSPDGRQHSASSVYYGYRHPMKPHRITMTHSLLMSSPFWTGLQIKKAAPIRPEVLRQVCTRDYYDFLSRPRTEATWDRIAALVRDGGDGEDDAAVNELEQCGITDDCPFFETIFDFSTSAAAMSVGAAVTLNHGLSDVSINWAGGLHHARIDRAEGFCYVNDIVLAILELLKYHARVLYIDIDIHHGDGVEEAFFNTNRVMTVSFHKFNRGDKDKADFFFPGTGNMCDIGPDGEHEAKGFVVNVPLTDGITDSMFMDEVFVPVIQGSMDAYQPTAIVLQSGADSVADDKIGKFNLSTVGHASPGRWLQQHFPRVPLMVLGGGGYTISNVARTWSYETISMLGYEDREIPHYCPLDCFYFEHVKQEMKWEIGAVPHRVSARSDVNNANKLHKVRMMVSFILCNLKEHVYPVSVPFEAVEKDAVDDPGAMATDQRSDW